MGWDGMAWDGMGWDGMGQHRYGRKGGGREAIGSGQKMKGAATSGRNSRKCATSAPDATAVPGAITHRARALPCGTTHDVTMFIFLVTFMFIFMFKRHPIANAATLSATTALSSSRSHAELVTVAVPLDPQPEGVVRRQINGWGHIPGADGHEPARV